MQRSPAASNTLQSQVGYQDQNNQRETRNGDLRLIELPAFAPYQLLLGQPVAKPRQNQTPQAGPRARVEHKPSERHSSKPCGDADEMPNTRE